MQWEFIVALVIAIPIILLPAVFVWYLNIGGIFQTAQKAARRTRAVHEEKKGAVAEAEQHITAVAAKAQPVNKELVGIKR